MLVVIPGPWVLSFECISHAADPTRAQNTTFSLPGFHYAFSVDHNSRWSYDVVHFGLSLWIPLVLFSAYPLRCATRRAVRTWRRRRRLRDHRCVECGYDLTANVSGICPECDTETPGKRPRFHTPAASQDGL